MNDRPLGHAPTSAQLERVREIIMGRQLGVIERRLDHLEKRAECAGVPETAGADQWEALRAGFQQQIDHLRREAEVEKMQRHEELRRLVEWVRQSLLERSQAAATPEQWQNLEQRLHSRIFEQQKALEQQLLEREQQYLQRLHYEWQRMQSAMAVATVTPQAQQQIAAAAQALSAAAATLSQYARSLNSPA